MKVIVAVLVIFACAASAVNVCQFSHDSKNINYVFQVPPEVEMQLSDEERDAFFQAQLSDKERNEFTLSEENTSYRFVATSYICTSEVGGELPGRHLIVDGDPFDRNHSQRVLFKNEFGNKQLYFMSGPVIIGGVAQMLFNREVTCYADAWNMWKTVDRHTSLVIDVTYASKIGQNEPSPSYTIPRGRLYASQLPMSEMQYELATERMLIRDMADPETRFRSTIIAQCGTFTQEELAQPFTQLMEVDYIDDFFLQVCRLIRETEAPPVKETPNKWILPIGIVCVVLLFSINWPYLWAYCRGRDHEYLYANRRRRD